MFSDRRKRDMANASVNLNKSYGYQPHHQYNQSGGSYGSNRGRGGGGGGYSGVGGGGGGSMVVLSRPRSSQNAGPKLSVPPPLNLPSLRKEHERVDSSGSSFHSGGGISGSGARPASSGMGWSKPAATASLQEGDGAHHSIEGVTRGSMLLASRAGAAEPLLRGYNSVEKVATLRGEDFPSLKASLPSASASGQKQKEGLNQKHKQISGEEISKETRIVSGMGSSLVDMRPQNQSGRSRVGDELSERPSFPDGLHLSEKARKKEPLGGPLPNVRLSPRSDWADDERDTSHGFRDRDKDHGYSKNEPYWDRGFDLPRSHVLPHKHVTPNPFDKPGQRENEITKSSFTQARPISGGGREANTWRVSSPVQNEVANYNKNTYGTRPSSREREAAKKSNYILSAPRENVWNNNGAREAPYQLGGRQPWNNNIDNSSNRGTFNRDGYGIDHHNRDKRPFFKSDKPHVEDPIMKDFGDSGFDVHYPFPVLGVAKKKKEALKQAEFHDPVQESFEAELERVQKMQEEERRRIIQEHERVIELARIEEEERLRLAREQDEMQRRLEEEARDAVFRTEQEKLEAARRVEELRKSKEEEKQKLIMEEERRKQAAKQKLLELEEKISRRQAEASKGCSNTSAVSDDRFLDIVKEKESADVVDWEESERMVDRITMSSALDLSVPIRSFESNVAPQFSRDGSLGFPDRQKPSWRKGDIESGGNSRFISQNMENAPHSPQSDAAGGFLKGELFGTSGYVGATSYYKPGFPEHSVDQSWRVPGDGRQYGRKYGVESESRESCGEQYGDAGWGQSQGRAPCGPYSPYPEKLYQNPEGDDYYPFGRPRYSVRQPRVLPPPQESRPKSSFRREVEHPGPSTSVGGITYSHSGGTNSTVLASYIGNHQDRHVMSGSGMDEHDRFDSKLTRKCDSQSSLSVTSPPDSPVYLSHDDLDESADSSVLSASKKGEDAGLLEKRGVAAITSDSEKDSLIIATTSVSCWENEEWTPDSNERLQEDEYNQDEDGYQNGDKIHGVADIAQDLEEMHLQDKDSNLVLGFNEGVEVEIPSDDFEKCQQNSEVRFPLPQHRDSSLDGERPSVETSSGEQAAQSVEMSDPITVSRCGASASFQDTETTIQNLTVQPNSGRQAFELANKVDSTSNSTFSTQPVAPPHSIGLQPAPRQTAISHVPSTSTQMEAPVNFQFGLFSGPSLIPAPFPAIQIGSIQMPLPLHPQFGSTLTHIQQPQSPIIQFGQLRYTSPLSQGVLPSPPNSLVQANAFSTYVSSQNPGSLASVQHGQGNSANLVARNATGAASVSNAQISVLRRPIDVSDAGKLKNPNICPARASAVPPHKQGELSGKSELPSRRMSHGKSNLERQSGYQVQTNTTAGRSSGVHPSGIAKVSQADSGGYRRYRRQRVEFRVREPNWPSYEENRNGNGRAQNSTRNGSRQYVVSNKSQKQASDSSASGLNPVQKSNSGGSLESRPGKDAVGKNPLIPSSGQANPKTIVISETEMDAPLQSGIVHVFEQHGIEAPSDDDDFIEVRSKRQMLNDRREQKEKEIKEKSQASKASRKPRSTLQNSAAAARSNRSPPASRVVNNKQFNPVSNRHTLAPIGTPSPKSDLRADEISGSSKSSQAGALPLISRNDQNPTSSFVFSNKIKVVDNFQTSVESWANQLTDQPVMDLTQSQLDEAMKPVSLLSCVSVENGANRVSGPNPKLVSVVPKNFNFPSTIKSSLAEGKIQFGAVTSSTVIPPCGGLTENESSLYFENDNKHRNPSSAGMENCDSEAVVAAITNDETSGNALGTGSVLPVETKIYGGAKLDDGQASGTVGGQPSVSKAEESLVVSLPADLSVDTPISLWPQLQSPHNSNQMITHFPPGPPHFPFYDVNPMLRGPIYAFGTPHDSDANQSQSQKGPGTASGPPTTWQQQGHSGVDSFYAPPAGFTGPFLAPPGAMPGVQGPPHMFVYNHFAPVGQYGGLSFMGTTYVPSGKQPDWKHNPNVSSSPVGADGDGNNPNVTSMQCNIMPGSLQHLPMPSPLVMFDPSHFQSSSQEMPVRARWPYMPFSGPPTMQIQKQQETVDGSNLQSSQFSNNMLPPPPNRYPNTQTSTVANPMVESSISYSSTISALPPKPTTTLSDSNSSNTKNPTGPAFKPPQQQQQHQLSSQEKNTTTQHVGGSSHHHHQHQHQHQHQHNRRSSFHGRIQPTGRERGFSNNTRVKQIYVAKQTSNSNTSSSSTTTTSPSL
ncbi:unnamed protein product [Cochlearia groenlandica]